MILKFIKKNVLWLSVISLLAFLLLRSDYKQNKEDTRTQSNLETLRDIIKKSTLKNGDTVVSKRSLIVTQQEFKNQRYISDSVLNEMSKKFKSIKTAVVFKTKVEVREVQIPYETKIPCEFDREFRYKDRYFEIFGRSNELGLYNVGLNIESSFKTIVGVKKGYWNNTIETDLYISNQAIQVLEMNTQTAKIRVKRIGFGGFVGVDYTGKPTAGIGLVFVPLLF